jgi:hypothetical protein
MKIELEIRRKETWNFAYSLVTPSLYTLRVIASAIEALRTNRNERERKKERGREKPPQIDFKMLQFVFIFRLKTLSPFLYHQM